MATTRDYYEILGVNKNSTKEEIKSQYRKMALKYHPDRNKEADAETKFKEVNEAYEVLSDENKKQAYDQYGHAAFKANQGGFGGFGNNAGPFRYTYTSQGSNPFEGMGFDFSDPFEIFETFFGGGGGFGRAYRPKPHYVLRVEFMEAVKGLERKILHQGTEYSIKIPAGADSGTRIRFEDFEVSIEVKPDSQFKREGYDIFVTKEIPLTVAILGGTIEAPTVDGEVKLKIRPGTQANTMIRLREKGVKHIRGGGKGDEYVQLLVTIPKDLNREQKKLIKRLHESMTK